MIRQVQPFSSWKNEFVPLGSEQHAQQRIDALLSQASELMECSTADTFQWKVTGNELTPDEVSVWLSQARYRAARYLEEVRALRHWLFRQKPLVKVALPKQPDMRQSLMECVVFMEQQFRKGQPFPEEGKVAFERARALLDLKPYTVVEVPALLRQARANKNDRLEDEMRYGGWVAMVTEDATAVDKLADIWMAAFQRSDEARAIACSSVEPLVDALASLGRFEKAREIIDLVAPYVHPLAMLMYVATNSQTEEDLCRVTESLETIPDASRRVWLLLQLFRLKKDIIYWQLALETARVEGCFKNPRREQAFYVLLIRAALAVDEIERVRDLLPRLPPSRLTHVRSLVQIYIYTGQEEDKLHVLAEVDELTSVEQIIPLYEFVRALMRHGEYGEARRFLTRAKTPILRCAVHAALSYVSDGFDAKMLDACEREYFAANVKSAGFKDLLEIFIRTQAQAGRLAIATNAAGFILEGDRYCLTLLYLYTCAMGKTLPQTMLERWNLHFL